MENLTSMFSKMQVVPTIASLRATLSKDSDVFSHNHDGMHFATTYSINVENRFKFDPIGIVKRVPRYLGWKINTLITGIGISYIYIRLKYSSVKSFVSDMRTRLISILLASSKHVRFDINHLKSNFRDTVLTYINSRNPTHSHPESAAWRSSCNKLSATLAGLLSMRAFSWQASNSDVSSGMPYYRVFHWHKDCSIEPSLEEPGARDLISIVDVDYYIDMNEFLLTNNQPILLYTFAPSVVAHVDKEFSFKFGKDSIVDYKVSGGASYSHKVWNYSVDCVSVGNWYTTKHYVIDRRAANNHHEYVFLIPTGTWYGVYAWLAKFMGIEPLKTLEVNDGDFNILDSRTASQHTRSIARVGEYNCATTDIVTAEAISSVSRNSSIKIGNATAQSWLANDRAASAAMVDYLRTTTKQVKANTVAPAVQGLKSYTIVNKLQDYDPDSKCLMVSYMSPVLPNSLVPADNIANDKAAVNGRILLPSEEAVKLVGKSNSSSFLMAEMINFVTKMIPIPNAHIPTEIEVVYENQNRPNQRALLEQADSIDVYNSASNAQTFMKAEPYVNKASDPRVITTYPTPVKREYSRYLYALNSYVKELHWYTFGRTPLAIAEAVSSICMQETEEGGVNCADANRMDGHVSEVVRTFEQLVLARFFTVEHGPIVSDLHKRQYKISAKTSNGFKYYIDFVRGSGSPETALLNSTVTKFIDYLGRRLAGLGVDEAYNARGLFAGDDTISSSFAPGRPGSEELVRAAAMVGQSWEVDYYGFGMPKVNFLSRYFTSDVWFGGEDSTCDLPRALGKLNVTVKMSNMEPLVKLQQKLMGLALTDANTPVISNIIETAIRLGMDLKFDHSMDYKMKSYWAQYDASVQWPNTVREPDRVLDAFLPNCNIFYFESYLTQAMALTELLSMPLIVDVDTMPISLKAPITVIDGEVYNLVVDPVTTEMKTGDKIEPSLEDSRSNQINPNKIYCFTEAMGKCNRGGPGVCPYLHKTSQVTVSTAMKIDSVVEPVGKEPYKLKKINFVKAGTLNITNKKPCRDFTVGKCFNKTCQFEHVRYCKGKDNIPRTAAQCTREGCTYVHA